MRLAWFGVLVATLGSCGKTSGDGDDTGGSGGSTVTGGASGGAMNTGGASAGSGAVSVLNTGGALPTGGVIGSPCVQPEVTRSVPNILLVIDRSSSMKADDGPTSRWENLRETLVGEDASLVAGIGAPSRLGMAFFAGHDPEAADPAQCPLLNELPILPITPEHVEALRKGFAALEPGGTNPTGESLDALWGTFGELDPEEFHGPNAMVLVTDGEPDSCEAGTDLADRQARSEAAVERAYAAGVRTLVMGLGTEISEEHLRRLTNLGRGFPANDATARFVRGGGIEVLRGLARLFQELVFCSFEIDVGIPEERASMTRVQVDDEVLSHRAPDGWYLDGPSRIIVEGTACSMLKGGRPLQVYLPCGGPIPLPP